MTEEKYLNKVTPDMALLCVSMKLYQTITQRNHSSPLCIGQVDKYSQHKFERTVFWLPRWVVVGLVPSSTSFFHPRIAHTHIYIKILTCHRRVLFTLLYMPFTFTCYVTRVEFGQQKLLDTNYGLYTIRINDFVRHTRIWIRHFFHVIECYMKILEWIESMQYS